MPHCHLCSVDVERGRVCAPTQESSLWADPIAVENCTNFLIKMQERPSWIDRLSEPMLSTSDAFKTLMHRAKSDSSLVHFYFADDVVQGRHLAEAKGEER